MSCTFSITHVTKLFFTTYTAKVLVQELHVAVQDLQGDELVVLRVNGTTEVEAGIPEGSANP